MPRLTLAAQSARDADNLAPTSERLINLYAVPAPEGSRAPLVLRSVPGTRSWVSLPGGPFLRALANVEGTLYAVSSGALYRITSGGLAAYLADVTDDAETAMVGHRDDVTIASGDAYALLDASAGTLSNPGSGRLTNVGSVAFLDQYTLLGEADGREIEWTEIGDPSDRNALHFATAEARDDKIVRIMESGAYLYVFKERSLEVWHNTGRGGASAFLRIQGSVGETGLLDFNLVCKTPTGIFGVGHDKVAYLMEGGGASSVSTPAVNQALQRGTPTHCFYYEDRGHRFCVIRFADRPAWVYDTAMGLWHERSSGASHGPWDIICSAYCYEQWLLGSRTGRVYKIGIDPVDAEAPMRRTVVSRPLYMEGADFSISMLEVLGRFGRFSIEETAPNWLTDAYGFPLEAEDGGYILAEEQQPVETHNRPARIWMRVSRDGGNTFGRAKTRDIGKVGEYEQKTRWRGLGQFSSFTAELNITDPVDVPLLSDAIVEVA